MIKLIVGLGNPGQQYEKTRHNVGFLFLDALATEFGCGWGNESRFEGFTGEIRVSGSKVLLLKPSVYMNRSGQSVGKMARYYKLVPENILVIHDELDFEVGVVRLKKGGGHAGHNGLRDIVAHLESGEFYRLRIGIGRPAIGRSVADYVLSVPSKKEAELLDGALSLSKGFVGQMVAGGMAAVMNKLNVG